METGFEYWTAMYATPCLDLQSVGRTLSHHLRPHDSVFGTGAAMDVCCYLDGVGSRLATSSLFEAAHTREVTLVVEAPLETTTVCTVAHVDLMWTSPMPVWFDYLWSTAVYRLTASLCVSWRPSHSLCGRVLERGRESIVC